jgi:hypothetical protein
VSSYDIPVGDIAVGGEVRVVVVQEVEVEVSASARGEVLVS